MTLLLDTHVVLWFWWDDSRLSPLAKSLIEDRTNEVLVSRAVPWEVAIKVSLKKLDIGRPYRGFFQQHISRSGMRYLETSEDHLATLVDLPFHHKDPFDRLMIAQGITDSISIVSIDSHFDLYGVVRIWD